MVKEPLVIQNPEAQEYYFQEGCYILELSNSEHDEQVSIARARVLPDTETKLHLLSHTIERYIILQGKGDVILGNNPPVAVNSNDVVIIPANCPQAIRNTGIEDLIFLVVCSPRFVLENYHEC